MKRIEIAGGGKTVVFPIAPDELRINGSARLQTFGGLDGDAELVTGATPDHYGWQSMMPGEDRKSLVNNALGGRWREPGDLLRILRAFKDTGRVVRLSISGTRVIKRQVKITTLENTYTGGHGDIGYTIEMVDHVDVTIDKKPKKKKRNKGDGGYLIVGRDKDDDEKTDRKGGTLNADGKTVTYTVKPGDTLFELAARFLGKGSRWREIHDDNQPPMGKNPDTLQVGWKLKIRTDE